MHCQLISGFTEENKKLFFLRKQTKVYGFKFESFSYYFNLLKIIIILWILLYDEFFSWVIREGYSSRCNDSLTEGSRSPSIGPALSRDASAFRFLAVVAKIFPSDICKKDIIYVYKLFHKFNFKFIPWQPKLPGNE